MGKDKVSSGTPGLSLLIISHIHATQIALNSRVTSVNGRTELRNISAITSAETEIVKPLARLLNERERARRRERCSNGVLQFPTPRSGQFTHGEN